RARLRARPNQALTRPEGPVPTVQLETWPEMTAISIRFYGELKEAYKPWLELLSWARESVPDLANARFLGLWFDDWSGLDESRYRYEASIVPATPLSEPPPNPFFIRTFDPGTVAVAHASGHLDLLNRAWMAFATGWLPFSGLQPRGEFVLDEYDADWMLAQPARQLVQSVLGKISIRMCLPVQDGPCEL
ncbi:MAG: GyrI-like domain-containing protein, partial [Verrucomicrobiota bacterium]